MSIIGITILNPINNVKREAVNNQEDTQQVLQVRLHIMNNIGMLILNHISGESYQMIKYLNKVLMMMDSMNIIGMNLQIHIRQDKSQAAVADQPNILQMMVRNLTHIRQVTMYLQVLIIGKNTM